MQTPHIATAADYADAMLVARRAKAWVFFLLLLMLLAQIALFLTARYTDIVPIAAPPAAEGTVGATTLPSKNAGSGYLMHYVLGITTFLGLILPVLMALLLLVLVMIMLVGRLLGVAAVTSAFIWCLVLALLLFPWQALLNNVGLSREEADFKVPGVLYTWSELTDATTGAKFKTDPLLPDRATNSSGAILSWARYVGFPVVAIVLLLLVQLRSKGFR